MTTVTTGRPSTSREIPVRRLAMDYSASFCVDGANPTAPVNPGQLWLIPDDPIFSHFLAMLSALFPHGEEFFVTTVRDNRAGIGDDGVLRRQINAFIGQEGMHGREHRTLNELLAPLGYPVEAMDRGVARICQQLLRLPTTLPLAVTAASEHLTGTLAPEFLNHPSTNAVLLSSDDRLTALVHWHALEELEHKNVAFDVLAAVDGRYLVRAAGFWIVAGTFVPYGLSSWIRAVANDRARITGQHRRRFWANLRRQSVLSPRVGLGLLAYLRPGFHPDDTNTDHLVDEWRQRLADRAVPVGHRTP